MGHEERLNVYNAMDFKQQLDALGLDNGCVHTVLVAMGADVDIYDVIEQKDFGVVFPNMPAYFAKHNLDLIAGHKIEKPVSLREMRRVMDHPKGELLKSNIILPARKAIKGFILDFGGYEENVPHVIGILPRNRMTRNVRKIYQVEDGYTIIDSSHKEAPVYPMSLTNIVYNINAFVLNNIPMTFYIVTNL